MFERFSARSRRVMSRANNQARRFHQAYVGTECILLGLLDDGPGVLTDLGVDRQMVRREVEKLVPVDRAARPPRGLTRTPRAQRAIRFAIAEARRLRHRQVKPEHLLLGLLGETRGVAAQVLQRLGFKLDQVRELVLRMMGVDEPMAVAVGPSADRPAPVADDDTAFERFSVDLTQLAREHRLDPLVARQVELERLMQILCRRTKGHVVLLGEAGVGKTALVEGLAQRMVARQAPPALRHRPIVSLDLTSLIAGAGHRGDVESRLHEFVEQCRRTQAIIFIDEMHMLVKAGDSTGGHDVANLLKSALARQQIQCIGATTTAEFERTIGRDPSLRRRFQPLMIEPAGAAATRAMVWAMRKRLEAHHQVRITAEAVDQAVRLSDRYIAGRFQPDKAFDVIDEASARVRLLSARRLAGASVVDGEAVAQVVAAMSGLPVGRLKQNESTRWTDVKGRLEQQVVGQSRAVEQVARVICRRRAGLGDLRRPIASLLLAGPAGTGKSRLAEATAEQISGRSTTLVRFDLAGFNQPHDANRLIGAAPGQVGHDRGGQLTEAIRRRPGAVLLIEHVDLAHETVRALLLQIMEEGRLTDGQGRKVNFHHSLVMMTCDIEDQAGAGLGFGASPAWDAQRIKAAAAERLRGEFFNRIDQVLVFGALCGQAIERLLCLEMGKLGHLLARQDMGLSMTAAARRWLVDKTTAYGGGAKAVRRVVDDHVRDPLSEALLAGDIRGPVTIRVDHHHPGATVTLDPVTADDAGATAPTAPPVVDAPARA